MVKASLFICAGMFNTVPTSATRSSNEKPVIMMPMWLEVAAKKGRNNVAHEVGFSELYGEATDRVLERGRESAQL
jgi:hypothetical protein